MARRQIGRKADDHWVVSCVDCPPRVGRRHHFESKAECLGWWDGHVAEHHAAAGLQTADR